MIIGTLKSGTMMLGVIVFGIGIFAFSAAVLGYGWICSWKKKEAYA